MIKTRVKFRKDRVKAVEEIALTRYLLQTEPGPTQHGRSTHRAQRKQKTMSPSFSSTRREKRT